MPHIIVAPELETVVIERHGIFTVPVENATVSCNCLRKLPCTGIDVRRLPLEHRGLELLTRQMEDKFVSRQVIRGYELLGSLRLHGPWPSYNFNERLTDISSSIWRDALTTQDGEEHPERTLAAVFEHEGAFNPYMDYLIVGEFARPGTLIEYIKEED